MRLTLLSVIALLITSIISLQAQSYIGIGSQGLSEIPDTVSIGDSIPINFWVVNKGESAYTGIIQLNFMGSQDTMVFDTVPLPNKTISIDNFKPKDSIKLFHIIPISDIFKPAQKNIIVVWPTGEFTQTDTAFAIRYFELEDPTDSCKAPFDYRLDGYTFTGTNSAVVEDAQYIWYFGNGNVDSNVHTTYQYPSIDSTYTVCLQIIDNDGCRDLKCEGITLTGDTTPNTFIKEVFTEKFLNIFPTPVSETLYVALIKNTVEHVRIYNFQGQEVIAQKVSEIDVHNLFPGIYFVEVTTTDQHIYIQKFIKN